MAVLSLSATTLGAAHRDPVHRVVSVPDADMLRTPKRGLVRFAPNAVPEAETTARELAVRLRHGAPRFGWCRRCHTGMG